MLIVARRSSATPGTPTIPGIPGRPTPGELTLQLQIYGRQAAQRPEEAILDLLGVRPAVASLANAQVIISQGRQTVRRGMSDNGGRFATRLSPGTYDVTVSADGYRTNRVRIPLTRRDAHREIYLDAQPGRTPGQGEDRGPQRPAQPPTQLLQLRILVRFPVPAKPGRPAHKLRACRRPARSSSARRTKTVTWVRDFPRERIRSLWAPTRRIVKASSSARVRFAESSPSTQELRSSDRRSNDTPLVFDRIAPFPARAKQAPLRTFTRTIGTGKGPSGGSWRRAMPDSRAPGHWRPLPCGVPCRIRLPGRQTVGHPP